MENGSHRSSRYEPAEERAWHLSILAGQGVSSFAVHALDDGQVVALGWGNDHSVLSSDLLPLHPKTVSFVTLPEWSTLVPDGALVPGTEAQHLSLVHGGVPSGAMRDEPVRSLGATCIYVHDDREEHAVLNRFPNARALPMQGLMVRAAKAHGANSTVVLLHRGADRADVAVVDHGRLLLSNTFPTRSAQDVLYFTLLALEQTGLTPSGTQLLYGGTHLSDAERDLLARYIANTASPCTLPWVQEVTTAESQPYRWLAALEQFGCVS
jgi:hypothetical protein